VVARGDLQSGAAGGCSIDRVMPSSHYRQGQDKTFLFYLVGGVNRIGDKSRLFSVVLTAFGDWTKQFRQFCLHRQHGQDKTRQDSLALSVSAV